MVCTVLYFEAQYALRLRSPLTPQRNVKPQPNKHVKIHKVFSSQINFRFLINVTICNKEWKLRFFPLNCEKDTFLH